MSDDPILSVKDLHVRFAVKGGKSAHAVRGLEFEVARGETLAIVGESGSGKSVSAMALLGLLPDTATVEGEATFEGQNLLTMNEKQLRKVRGNRISMIFQDPMTAFNPVFTIGDQIGEIMKVHNTVPKAERKERAAELLAMVGVPEPRRRVDQYPHEFSGGMRQRAMIAMAIANDPELLIADEPTTALDVTIQAQVMEVLADIQERVGAAMLLITHDLGLVAGTADRVQVMYGGRVFERGPVRQVFYQPSNPYTRGLLSSLPRVDGTRDDELVPIPGAPPSLLNMPKGCSFGPRCPYRTEVCVERPADLVDTGIDQVSRCHHAHELPALEAAST